MSIRVSDGLRVLLRTIPVPGGVNVELSAPTMFWIVPPVHVGVAVVHVPALPVTVRPAVVPVLLSTIPFAAPFAEMLRNVSPLAPIVVLAMLRGVPVLVESVLT